jgi:hypothetical protein
LASVGGPAEASVVIDVSEVGGNVVTAGSGRVDLTGLTFEDGGDSLSAMNPSFGSINSGSSGRADFY